MTDVKRYDMVSHEGEPVGDPEPVEGGRYVLASDHDAAIQRAEAAERALASARSALGGFGEPDGPFGGDVANGVNAISIRCAAAEKAREDLRSERDAAVERARITLEGSARLLRYAGYGLAAAECEAALAALTPTNDGDRP